MKKLFAVMLGLSLVLAVSCKQKQAQEQPKEETKPAATETQPAQPAPAAPAAPAGEAAKPAAPPESETMDQYVKSAQAKLDKLQGEIGELETKAQNAGAEAKAGMEKGIAELKVKAAAAEEKLKELKASGSTAWEGLKKSVDDAMDDLEKTYEKVRGQTQG